MAEDGFKETTEGVSAKLNVEVPEQALTTLTALSKQMENYRIQMEAAVRANGDHKGYLESMPQISELATAKLKEWCNQVERAIDLKGKLGDYAGIPGSVGQDSANPFGSQVLGRGDMTQLLTPMARNDPTRVISMGAQRGLVDKEAVGGMSDEQIQKLADALAQSVGSTEPTQAMPGARPPRPGQHPKHDPKDDEGLSPHRLEKGALHGRDLVGNVLGEMGPGKSIGDAVGAGRDVVGELEGAGGLLGKAAGVLGPVGAGVGLALTANQLLQMGGQRIQSYRNLGLESGDGVSKGMEYDMKAKMLALDPFITTAQAREVIQGALNSGMGGDQFDTVTAFIAKNLKDMNVQVADSVKMLQTNVEKGGMSIDQLGTSLANVTAMAQGGAQGQGELMQNFAANTSALTHLGVSGQQGKIAEQFMGAFKESPLLSQVGDKAIQQALQNPVFQSQVAIEGGVTGAATPGMAIRKLAQGNQLSQATWKLVAKIAGQAKASSSDPEMQLEQFMSQMRTIGFDLEPNVARGLLDEISKPGGADKAIQQGKEANEAGLKPVDHFGIPVAENFKDFGARAKTFVGTIGNTMADLFTLNWGEIGPDINKGADKLIAQDKEYEAATARFTNPVLQRAVSQYGSQDLQVFDPQGKNPRALDQNNKEQRDKLAAGELLIARHGGTPQKLADFGSQQSAQQATGNVNVTAAPLTVKYEGPISGPSAVPLTANQMQANAGFGGATNQNPPVGNR